MTKATKTREQWLQQAMTALRPMFERQANVTVPDCYVSAGWPKGSRNGNKTIGQCFPPTMVADAKPALFVSPVLDDSLRVLDVLAHEMTHAAVGTKCGHRGAFRDAATAIGLEGPMTATHAGEALRERLQGIVKRIGEYPSAKVSPTNPNKQQARMLRLVCEAWDDEEGGSAGCGMVIRTTRKWLNEIGAPSCACGGRFVHSPTGSEAA